MKKKLLSMLLALAMILSMFPVGGLAAEVQEEEKTPVFDDADYLKESKNKTWIDINDPQIIQAQQTTSAINVTCKIGNFKQAYKPYREPEEILMSDFDFSAEEAAQIMNGSSSDARVAYISSETELESRFLSANGAEILVLTKDITLTKGLKTNTPFTFLAAQPYSIKASYTVPTYLSTMLSFGDENTSLTADVSSKIQFSNIILDGDNKATTLKIYARTKQENSEQEKSVLLEGACVINGQGPDGEFIASLYGNVSCLGCTAVSYSEGFYGDLSGNTFVKDCNFFICNTFRRAFYANRFFDCNASLEVSNSFFSGGLQVYMLHEEGEEGDIDNSCNIQNSVFNNTSMIDVADLTMENSLVRWQDFSRFIHFYSWGGETHYGRKHPGLFFVTAQNSMAVDHCDFYSSMLIVFPDEESTVNAPIDITNCDFVWDLPISEAERKNWEVNALLAPTGINVEVRETSPNVVNIDAVNISGYIWGVSFNSHISIKNSYIYNNEYGLWDTSEYKSGIENSAKVANSQIHDNLVAGICANSAEIFVSDSTSIANNGSMDQPNSGGLVFNLSEEPEGWDEYDEENSGDYNVPRRVDVKNSTFTGNVSATNGGAIRIEDPSIPVSVMGTEFKDNTAASSGGAISLSDYSKLQVDATTEFRKNSASVAYFAPENASELYPNIKFARTSLSDHPLNNYDISYIGESRLNTITSVIPPEGLTVSWKGLLLEEVQSQLEEGKSQVKVTLDNGNTDEVSVTWDAINSELAGAPSGIYTLYGVLDTTGKNFENPGEYPAPIKVTVKAPINSVDSVGVTVPHKTSLADLETLLLQEAPVVTAHLEDGTEKTLPISSWSLDGLSEEYSCGEHELTGDIDLSGEETISNLEYSADLKLKVVPRIVWADQPKPIKVLLGTSEEDVLERLNRDYPVVSVTLSEGGSVDLPVVWNISDSGYNAEAEAEYTVTGTLTFDENLMLNPDEVPTSIVVKVVSPKPTDIIGVEEAKISVPSNVFLGTTDREHAIGGVASAIDLPEKVTVNLRNGETHNLPVDWQVGGFDPNTLGVQNFTGTVLIPDDSNISNPQGISAPLIVTVESTHFDVLSVSTNGLEIEVLPGTTLAEIQEKLEENGKPELHVNAYYVYYDYNEDQYEEEVFNFCDFSLSSSNNPDWEKEMDTPGEYELRVTLPENFTVFDESTLDTPEAKIKVTVLQPLDIIEVKPANMNAYQSVEPENLDDVPPQVMVELSNGMEIPVDVDWDWTGSHYKKDLVLPQTVNGTLTNLPSKAKQPDGREPFQGQLDVNVIAVNYEVTEMQHEDYFNSNTLLSLEEITELEHPTANLTIASTTPGIELTTTYEAAIAFETEHNPDFDRKVADIYLVTGTLQVPFNITVPAGTLLEDIGLQTHPVTVKKKNDSEEEYDIDPIYIMVGEGTAFEDIKKPETAEVPFDIKGPDGKYKRELVEVDWGTGEGYNPNPDGVTDETPVAMTVYGTLSGDCPDYANVEEEPVPLVPLVIKVVRAYEVTAITPSRIPETGELEVKLGSSLQDIYNLLDTHTVELTLKSTTGAVRTESVTFRLEEDGNEQYDPETLGTYTLTPCLELPENITNPDNLKIQIVVKTRKYTISSTQGKRIGGILAGTQFQDLPLPSTATVIRNDRQTEDIPVTWNEGNYDPNKIGSQVIRGTLNTPLPIHLENPNNRQPSIIVTTVNPDVTILSLKLVTEQPSKMRKMASEDDTSVPGYQEYRYKAKILHKDATVTEEIISLYEEIEAQE